MLIEVWPGVHSLRKPAAFCASSSATDFAVERSITDLSKTWTAPTRRPPWPGESVAPGPAAGESAATRSRPPMTCTVPVRRRRGSGRPPGVTTTSPRLTCAEAAVDHSAAERIAAAISAAPKASLLVVRMDAPVCVKPHKHGGFSRKGEPPPARIAYRLAREMRRQVGPAGLRPSQPIGQIGCEPLDVGDDARECPVRKRDRGWLRRRRKSAEHDVDAGRLVLAVPLRRKATREAHPARAVLRRNDPDDGAARPGEAAREKRVRLLQRRRDIGGENGVVRGSGHVRRVPSAGEHMRAVIRSE